MAENSLFHEIHKELDAKMVPAGKWNLPLFYPGGTLAEHRNTFSGASLFDMTGVRAFQFAGEKAAEKINDLLMYACVLPVGGMMENFLLHDDGTLAAALTVCRMQENDFMLLTDRNTPDKECAYLLEKFSSAQELTGAMAFLSLAGKRSGEILTAAGAEKLPEENSWQMISITDDEGDEFRCIAICRRRFGESAYDLCCNARLALEVYGAIYRIPGVSPAGIGAWESLRIESGTPGVPSELHSGKSPAVCGFEVPDDERDFPGREALTGTLPAEKLIIAELERHPLAPGTVLMLANEIPAGVVTSGAFCPVIGKAQVFAFIDAAVPVEPGTELFYRSGEKILCTAVKTIFG